MARSRLSEQELHALQSRPPGLHASGSQAPNEPSSFPASADDAKSEVAAANCVTWRGESGCEKIFRIGGSPRPTDTKLSSRKIVQSQDACSVFPSSPTSIVLDHSSLPNYKASSSQLPHAPPRPAVTNAQLTIFYCGTVNVYDDVPADKAQAIMLLAGTGNSRPTAAPPEAEKNNLRGSAEHKAQAVPRRAAAELPQARKASLARFLEKRKDRVQVKQQVSEQTEERASSPKKRCTELPIAKASHGEVQG